MEMLMVTCTFFGHRDATDEVKHRLREAIINLIENNNVDTFLCGTHGNFDKLVKHTLISLQKVYPHITYTIVLSHLPATKTTQPLYTNFIYPEGIENVPPKFAIIYRNKWMIKKSDYVITYVRHNLSNTSKFREIAEKKGKIVITIE